MSGSSRHPHKAHAHLENKAPGREGTLLCAGEDAQKARNVKQSSKALSIACPDNYSAARITAHFLSSSMRALGRITKALPGVDFGKLLM